MRKSPSPNMSCQSFFNRPPFVYASAQGRSANTYLFGPLCKSKPLPLILKNIIASPIVALFCVGCPSAIVWRIPKIVVNALHAMLWPWTLTHISEKLFKAILPLWADHNTSPAVTSIRFICGATATIKDSEPDPIFYSFAQAVTPRLITSHFFTKATTTVGVTCCHVVAISDNLVSAIALAKPPRNLSLRFANKTKHDQPPEPLAGQISNLLTGYRHYLRDVIRGIIGLHHNLLSYGPSRERFTDAARHFLLANYRSIIPKIAHLCYVSPLTESGGMP